MTPLEGTATVRRPRTRPGHRLADRTGLSLVELLVAMLVLAVGILGMAAGTGWMIRAVDLSRLDTIRAAALQSALEEVRSVPFDQVAGGSAVEGDFEVSWSVEDQDIHWRELEFVVVGPGRASGSVGPQPAVSSTASDTLRYRIVRP